MSGAEFLLPAILAGGAAVATSALTPKPKPPTPVRMPDPQGPEAMEARRRRIAERQAASGRESTILTGDTYGNSLLGE